MSGSMPVWFKRVQGLLGTRFSLETVPDVVHVLAAAGSLIESENLDKCVRRPWGSVANNISPLCGGLKTLNTPEVSNMLPEVDAADDLFLLCLFRAISSHVLTSGANLRAEPDLEMSLFTTEFANEDLPSLRAKLGIGGSVPRPIVLTRCGNGIDFSAPFFSSRDSVNSNNFNQHESPVLLVATKEAERDIEHRISEIPHAQASVFSLDRICEKLHPGQHDDDAYSDILLTPSLAVHFAKQVLGAQRISVECGPSISAQLYAQGVIKATSLSILIPLHDKGLRLPVLDSDPLFEAENIEGKSTFKKMENSEMPFLSLHGMSASSTPLHDAPYTWVYEWWSR